MLLCSAIIIFNLIVRVGFTFSKFKKRFTPPYPGAGVIDDNRILYAAFSEGDTSASGSVVCRFNLTQIDFNFDTTEYYHFNDGGRPKAKDRTPPTCGDMESTSSPDIFVSSILSSEVI